MAESGVLFSVALGLAFTDGQIQHYSDTVAVVPEPETGLMMCGGLPPWQASFGSARSSRVASNNRRCTPFIDASAMARRHGTPEIGDIARM
jgi:hypothetical protein